MKSRPHCHFLGCKAFFATGPSFQINKVILCLREEKNLLGWLNITAFYTTFLYTYVLVPHMTNTSNKAFKISASHLVVTLLFLGCRSYPFAKKEGCLRGILLWHRLKGLYLCPLEIFPDVKRKIQFLLNPKIQFI